MCAIRRRIDGLDTTKELNAENAEKKLKFKKLSGLCELGGKKRRKLSLSRL